MREIVISIVLAFDPAGRLRASWPCSGCIKPLASLIKILITDAAYFIAAGKEFSFSELCLFFGVAGVIMMRSFLVCFLFLEEFFFFPRGRNTVLKTQFHELIIVQ